MTVLKRRPNVQPYGAPTPEQVNQLKKFNKRKIFGQGFRQQLTASSTTTLSMSLTSPGKELIGISIIPVGTGDMSDTQVSFVINNVNILNVTAAQNLNPNFVGGGMIYFPTSQPLTGNDTIQANFVKNDANNITVIVDVFYVPR